MFHTILTLSYLIPNLYLFIRIWQLFIPKRYRILYIIIYAVLFSIYPFSNLFGERGTGTAALLLNGAANYLLPFYLYLFLFVLITDLLLLINYILRLIPRNSFSGEAFRLRALITITGLSVAVVIAGIINFNTIRTTVYQVAIPKKSSGITHLRIAFVSDFHLNETTPVRFVEKYAEKIKAINPDIMLYGGDILEGHGLTEKRRRFEEILGSISPKYGDYGVLGNHEHYGGEENGDFFSRAGIDILRDTFVVAGHSIAIAGRNDSQVRNRKSAADLMKMVPDSLPVILLDHRPTEPEQISKTSADIVFSGHTHDGQMFPINLITRSVYEISYGYKKKGNTNFFVSSGIRLWGPPVRTTGKSEILVVDVTLQ